MDKFLWYVICFNLSLTCSFLCRKLLICTFICVTEQPGSTEMSNTCDICWIRNNINNKALWERAYVALPMTFDIQITRAVVPIALTHTQLSFVQKHYVKSLHRWQLVISKWSYSLVNFVTPSCVNLFIKFVKALLWLHIMLINLDKFESWNQITIIRIMSTP